MWRNLPRKRALRGLVRSLGFAGRNVRVGADSVPARAARSPASAQRGDRATFGHVEVQFQKIPNPGGSADSPGNNPRRHLRESLSAGLHRIGRNGYLPVPEACEAENATE